MSAREIMIDRPRPLQEPIRFQLWPVPLWPRPFFFFLNGFIGGLHTNFMVHTATTCAGV